MALRLIAAFRLTKAALLIAAAIALLRGVTIPEWMARFPRVLAFMTRLEDAHRAHLVAAAGLSYAALFTVEGIGLWRQKRWAEYLTIIATSSLIPFEIYEVVQKATALRYAAIAVNVIIVVYLVWRVRKR